jgi:uncharacterized protein
MFALGWMLALAVGCGSGGGESGSNDVFAYDAGASLDVREVRSFNAEGARVHDVTYASPGGGRVPAFVVVPGGDGPFAGLIVQHGMSLDPLADEDRGAVLPVALDFARLGAVVLAIDAPFVRRSGPPVRFDQRDRAEQIQLIVDLRRAVDLLRSRDDVDAGRIAYLGISYGAAMGGLLAGIEHRIAAFVLATGDGGLVEHFGSRRDAGGSRPPLPANRRRRWLEAMKPIEPLRYVARAKAPLFFQAGLQDELVPPPDARRYQRTAPEPKQVKWYRSGHRLPPEATCDQALWLSDQIAIDRAKSVRGEFGGFDRYRCTQPRSATSAD